MLGYKWVTKIENELVISKENGISGLPPFFLTAPLPDPTRGEGVKWRNHFRFTLHGISLERWHRADQNWHSAIGANYQPIQGPCCLLGRVACAKHELPAKSGVRIAPRAARVRQVVVG